MRITTTPVQDGFYMPGEFEPHSGCILIWPERPGSWPFEAKAARQAFATLIREIAKSEAVYLAVSKKGMISARRMLEDVENVTFLRLDTDDAWARDVAPTFVVSNRGGIRAVNWEFNAWGGAYNGLYASWEKDNQFAKAFAQDRGYDYYDAAPFVLEGGSVHCDGEGTVLVTEACLLSPGRNPSLFKAEIEQKLITWLGAKKVLWIPRGIYQDETDEHVDNVCAFIRPGEVVLAWTDRKEDPQYELSRQSLEALENQRDAKGRKLIIHKLPIPDVPVCVKEEDLDGYVFEEGEEERTEGERLAASYVNFYFSNDAVLLPAFGGENEASDERARQIMKELCPNRRVVSVPARDILLGGGNIHCITQQIPRGKLCEKGEENS